MWHKTDAAEQGLPPVLDGLPGLYSATDITPPGMHRGLSVWQLTLRAQLALTPSQLAAMLPALSEDEHQRYLRYRQPADRTRYLVMRIALRRLLAERLQLTPAVIRLCYGVFGKPALMPLPGHAALATTLHFNVSHSGHAGLIALSPHRAVGVDIEAVREDVDQRVWQGAFSRDEQHYCQQSMDGAAFFHIWTAKEAVLKALGTGLAGQWSAVSVLPIRQGAYTVKLDAGAPAVQAWQLAVAPGYAAALALLD